MKRSALLLAGLAVLTLTSCKKEQLRGDGEIITEERDLSNFSEVTVIEADGSAQVHVTYGPDFRVQVRDYANLLPHFETEVANSTLYLRFASDLAVRRSAMDVFVTLPRLYAVVLNGSGDASISGNFPDFSPLTLKTTGSGNISIEGGKANRLTAISTGSGNVHAFPLAAEFSEVQAAGSGHVRVQATGRLKARLSGSGNVYYKGNPALVETEATGSGRAIPQ